MKDTNAATPFLFILVIFLLITSSIGETKAIEKSEENSIVKEKYVCDVEWFSLKTLITIKNNEREYLVEGKVVKLITDPLEMKSSDGETVAYATDVYNFFSEDDHVIVVGNEKIEMVGNVTFTNHNYTIKKDGEQVAIFTVDVIGYVGSIRDNNGNIIAKYEVQGIGRLDYVLTIYENSLMSDEAVNMIVACFYSDLAYERKNNSSSQK